MKAILKFDLDDDDDALRFKEANRALDYSCFIHEFREDVLRQYSKRGLPEKFKNGTPNDLLDHLYDRFLEMLNEHNLNG